MRILLTICLISITGCSNEPQPAEPDLNAQPGIDSPTSSTASVVKEQAPAAGVAKTKITAEDALRIHREQLGDNLKPGNNPVTQLIPFRDCYQRAWDNAHGDPDLQGVTMFGELEDLKREGLCWSIDAKYRGRNVVGFISESGDLIYAFKPQ